MAKEFMGNNFPQLRNHYNGQYNTATLIIRRKKLKQAKDDILFSFPKTNW